MKKSYKTLLADQISVQEKIDSTRKQMAALRQRLEKHARTQIGINRGVATYDRRREMEMKRAISLTEMASYM